MPKSGKSQVYLVDDHPVTREGLVCLINGQPDLEVCGEAATAARARSEIPKLMPDLVVVDISLATGASGLELIKDLSAAQPRLPILALSMHDEKLYAQRALHAGARGYVMKQEPTVYVMQAIRKILRGGTYLSTAMSEWLLHKLAAPQSTPANSEVEQLSDRELEVYRLLGHGHGTRQIAEELHVSISTVESYRLHIKEKLHFTSAPELMQRAVEWVRSQAL